MPELAERVHERAELIGAPEPLLGILCEPAGERPSGLPAILLLNAGILHRVGPSRMNVQLARALARDGFSSLRFDFSGIGDSGIRRDDLSFEERSIREVQGVMDHLENQHSARTFVLAGLCSGADVAYRTALEDPRVCGLICMDGYAYRTWRYWIHRYAPRVLRAESWWNLLRGRTYMGPVIRQLLRRGSPNGEPDDPAEVEVFRQALPPKGHVAAGYQLLANRGVRVLQIFTGALEGRYNYATQFRDTFRSVQFRGLLEVDFFAHATHTFTASEHQRALTARIRDWARASWPAQQPSALETMVI